MNPLDAEAIKVFEAMKMEVEFVDWLTEKELIHHNNYRALFVAGALERLMEFLVQGAKGKFAGMTYTNRNDEGLAANSP
jgi:hypothetical protein